jgi:PRC-barrel domain
MPAIDPDTLDRWRTLSIVDRDGGTVGSISEFYLDRETRYPTWALVNVGLFGARQMFVPLLGATEISDGLQVPYEKGHIKDAPRIDLHGELTPDEEATLFAHYGIDYQPATEETGVDETAGEPGAAADPGAAGAAGVVEPEAAAEPGVTDDDEPGPPEDASAAAEQDPAPDEWAAAGRPRTEGDNPGHAPATDDELAWPASPPPPGPITEPPTEPPEVPRTDRDR